MQKIPPIWIINMEKDKERRTVMEKHLSKFSVPYEFVPGVDGENMAPEEWARYSEKEAKKHYGRGLTGGEIGCVLAHGLAWQRIIDEEHEEVLVLEDDAILSQHFFEILQLRDQFPEDWEFINFYSNGRQRFIGEPIFDIHRIAEFREPANRLAVSLIRRSAAEKLMKHFLPVRMPPDDLTGRTYITDMIMYGIHPQIASIRSIPSLIQRPRSVKWAIIHRIKKAIHQLKRFFRDA